MHINKQVVRGDAATVCSIFELIYECGCQNDLRI